MSIARESELKYRLSSASDAEKILAAGIGEISSVRRQVNHYFDTREGELLRSGIILRLRRDGSDRLTLKYGGPSGAIPGHFDSIEHEIGLAADFADALLRDPALLWTSGLGPLVELERLRGPVELVSYATLVTKRHTIESDFVIEVDFMELPDGSQVQELEIETDDPSGARSWIESLFARIGVSAAPSTETKLETVARRLVSARASPASCFRVTGSSGRIEEEPIP
jgi:uncharacterized protein YjbK